MKMFRIIFNFRIVDETMQIILFLGLDQLCLQNTWFVGRIQSNIEPFIPTCIQLFRFVGHHQRHGDSITRQVMLIWT